MWKLLLCLFLVLAPVYILSNNVYASCYETLGLMSQDNYDGTCSCMQGYRMVPKTFGGGYQCESMNTYCTSEYGYGAEYDYLSDSCECSYGYVMDARSFGGGYECKSTFSYCVDNFGYNAQYNSLTDRCECDIGYVVSTDYLGEQTCVNGDILCREKYGSYSEYDNSSSSCVCEEGYTFNDDECVKKHNSAYFKLIELDVDNDYAVIESNYDGTLYEIEYSYGCYSIEDYLDEDVVINMKYDFTVDYGDYLVLHNDDEVCDITSADLVSKYTYRNPTPDIQPTYSNSTELLGAITWLYINGFTKYDNIIDFRSTDPITREEASKFFAGSASIFSTSYVNSDTLCVFTDSFEIDYSLVEHAILACKYGIMIGNKSKEFMPKSLLTQAQAITILVRMTQGGKDETGGIRYSNYYSAAKDGGLLNGLPWDISALDGTYITRGEMAILIYRAFNAIN